MLRRLLDAATEIKGHRELTRDINKAKASGDQDAQDTFRTGTLAAALTSTGRDARGEEVCKYVEKVAAAGDTDRIGWLRRR
ncbi:hypothetical protein ACFXKF_04025 [Streptomyces scopuliridis]|uniref:hypothetical protein n=1 Tax=Streptomyces scopuliridis TaxID=452529 RepID=UPI0036A20075